MGGGPGEDHGSPRRRGEEGRSQGIQGDESHPLLRVTNERASREIPTRCLLLCLQRERERAAGAMKTTVRGSPLPVCLTLQSGAKEVFKIPRSEQEERWRALDNRRSSS